jgi:DNA polymerase-3 subunit delta'
MHHAYLFDGPEGVGKELAALGLAQLLVCERREPPSAEACGRCRSCVRVMPRAGEPVPTHPDVVVLGRGLYDPAVIGRRSPEAQDISIDQVRTLVLSRVAFPPYEGRATVFIIRSADELSVAAASALLKTLEEPGPRTHFVLLSARANRLPDTIRSRTQRIRFGLLPEPIVVELLVERGVDVERANVTASLAGGSMATALALADPTASEQRRSFVSDAMAALDAGDLGPALDLAETAKKQSRDEVLERLRALSAALVADARVAVRSGRGAGTASRYAVIVEAMERLEANASVQLTVESMFIAMRRLGLYGAPM